MVELRRKLGHAVKVASVNPNAVLIGAGLLAMGGLVLFVWTRGGIAPAAQAAAGALVDAGSAAVTGAVGAAGAQVGLPLPSDTTTDASVARWMIDNHGHFEASRWASAGAYARGWWMDAGTGTPPPAGSPVAVKFGTGASPSTTTTTNTAAPAWPGLGGLWLDTAGPSFAGSVGWRP